MTKHTNGTNVTAALTFLLSHVANKKKSRMQSNGIVVSHIVTHVMCFDN